MFKPVAYQPLIQNIYNFFLHQAVQHTLIWLAYIVLFTSLQGVKGMYLFAFTNEVVKVFFYAIGMYFNALYLIPKYLSQKKFLQYSAFLLLTVILTTPLQVLALYAKASAYPNYQTYLLENQFLFYIMMFLFISFASIVTIVSQWIRHQRERKELETQNMQSELQFLKSQINPHFLFNTLNNLYALTLKKSDLAPEIVLKLSEMMRYMLYECNERVVPLEKEVNYLRNYLDLERLRQGKNIDISFQVDGSVENLQIAPLLFIPFVENCFKHGLNHQISDGYVHIYLEVLDNQLQLTIANSKPTIPNRFHKRSGGIGLVNVQRRLNLLYPNFHILKIQDTQKQYKVYLKIELNNLK